MLCSVGGGFEYNLVRGIGWEVGEVGCFLWGDGVFLVGLVLCLDRGML